MENKLSDVLPAEFLNGEYNSTPAFKLRDHVVLEEHLGGWPGPQKNVHYWYVLDNNRAVGMNENPSRGWSFPVIKYPKTPL